MRGVLKNLVDGCLGKVLYLGKQATFVGEASPTKLAPQDRTFRLSESWIKVGLYWQVPCKSSITEARQRIGAQVMCRLFHLVVRPLATSISPNYQFDR